jgi:hypothetical protein
MVLPSTSAVAPFGNVVRTRTPVDGVARHDHQLAAAAVSASATIATPAATNRQSLIHCAAGVAGGV